MDPEIHPIQSEILLVLLFKPNARFRDLNTTNVSSDHFTFHVKRLEYLSLIEKTDKGFYKLTPKGKEFANRFDTDSVILERQAKISILVSCSKKIKGKTHYLMQKRLKEPYYGFLGKITGKIRWGETIYEAAARELKEETGLYGKLKLAGIEHKIDIDKQGKLLEDKFFFVLKVDNPKGKLKKSINGGENIWMSHEQVLKSENKFKDVFDIFSIVNSKGLRYLEKKYKEKSY
jgi:ADP-ribose pyrophosphatase YjhB (NUDIX family)